MGGKMAPGKSHPTAVCQDVSPETEKECWAEDYRFALPATVLELRCYAAMAEQQTARNLLAYNLMPNEAALLGSAKDEFHRALQLAMACSYGHRETDVLANTEKRTFEGIAFESGRAGGKEFAAAIRCLDEDWRRFQVALECIVRARQASSAAMALHRERQQASPRNKARSRKVDWF
jgi:hypothetical protein